MKAGLAILLALLVTQWPVSAQGQQSVPSGFADVPIPGDVRIVRPDARVPRELSLLSGKWAGRWYNVLGHVLVIEQMSYLPPNRALVEVVNAWGGESESTLYARLGKS